MKLLKFFPTEGFPEKTSYGDALSGYGHQLARLSRLWLTEDGKSFSNSLAGYGNFASLGGQLWLEDGWIRIKHTAQTIGNNTARFWQGIDPVLGKPAGTIITGFRYKLLNYAGVANAALYRMYTAAGGGNYYYANLLLASDINDGKEHYIETKYIVSARRVEVYLDDVLLRSVAVSTNLHNAMQGTGTWNYLTAGGASQGMGDTTNIAGEHYIKDLYISVDTVDTAGDLARLGPVRFVKLEIDQVEGEGWTPADLKTPLETPLTSTNLNTPVISGGEQVSQDLSVTFKAEGLRETDIVKALVVGCRIGRDGASTPTCAVDIVSDGQVALGSTDAAIVATMDTWQMHQSEVNSVQAAAWTKASLEAADFRLRRR